MRIAFLADIHGNLAAFEAALEHVARQHVDRLIIVGDLSVGAPDSAACWRLAQSLGCPIVRGNHERYVFQYGTPEAPPEWDSPQFAPVAWAAAQFGPGERAAMAALPQALRLPDLPDILAVHASLRGDRDTVAAYTPEEQLAEFFPNVAETVIVRAHNHTAQVRLWGQRQIITTGAIGLNLDGHPSAQYLLLEQRRGGWAIRHQAVPYDVAATARRFHETGYLDQAGPLAQLYLREIVQAAHQIVPFLRAYARWQTAGLTLEQALERFLALY